jgi:type II secretory ATPase GspE/PulE/Tfp pilus assembly ATPase PilB-like protein
MFKHNAEHKHNADDRHNADPADNTVRVVDDLLARAIAWKASDLHFEPLDDHMAARFRLDGLLHDVDRLPLNMAESVIARLKVLSGLLTYRIDVPQEGSFRMGAVDVRVAVFPTVRGERAAVRFLHKIGQVSGLDELGLAVADVEALRRETDRPNGLLLVTGPAGAGKSTTLYAMARHILTTTPGRSVVSLEDPVEQRVAGLTQIQIQPHGELDYVRAMRSLLRQDVQVLLVGEIRDAETAHVVVDAALTGHLVMSTMHSGDPAETIARLLEMGIAPYQAVSALTVVCSQRLLRTLCRECGAQGCDSCAGTGFSGRTACAQIAMMNDRLRGAVLDHAPTARLRQVICEGRPDLAADAARLVAKGVTRAEEARRVLGDAAVHLSRHLEGA